MMVDLGHRQLKKELGVDGPSLAHSAGVQTVNSRRSLVSHGSLDEGF